MLNPVTTFAQSTYIPCILCIYRIEFPFHISSKHTSNTSLVRFAAELNYLNSKAISTTPLPFCLYVIKAMLNKKMYVEALNWMGECMENVMCDDVCNAHTYSPPPYSLVVWADVYVSRHTVKVGGTALLYGCSMCRKANRPSFDVL